MQKKIWILWIYGEKLSFPDKAAEKDQMAYGKKMKNFENWK